MKLLLINPNTTAAITERMGELARTIVAPATRITAVTGRFGARYVASRAAYAIAGHATLDAYAEHGADQDVVVLACFGDPALAALKEIAHQPVVGMAEASCLAAAALGGRFAIVTGGERWRPMLIEFVAALGLADRLAAVEIVAPTGADIAREPEKSLALLAEACRTAVTDHGADSVILGGAGLSGLADRIKDEVPVPLVDSLVAALRMAEMLAGAGIGKARLGACSTPPPVDTTGLGGALSDLMRGARR